ncbi:hypothetical protein C0Q92_30405 [Streptomyces albidoflavus]|uniref:Uncharacterized protein n=1 Tax=Streptomyces albidoflavus TaxID=1886 RepID=A0A8G1ZK75_9ACTN|nr:hypothetical protein C0Q92_30405 [Streptomyces albidoflavus]
MSGRGPAAGGGASLPGPLLGRIEQHLCPADVEPPRGPGHPSFRASREAGHVVPIGWDTSVRTVHFSCFSSVSLMVPPHRVRTHSLAPPPSAAPPARVKPLSRALSHRGPVEPRVRGGLVPSSSPHTTSCGPPVRQM